MAPVNAQRLMGRTSTVQSAAVAPQQQLVASPADTAVLKDISKSLTNIIQLLSQQNKQTVRDADQTRKEQERSRRKGIELNLERSFATVKNVATAVVAPVKSILDQIIQFFVTIFLGRALILLLNWFADENNRSKVRSIMRFLQDWWPSLVAGYILFGTGFGRIVRKVAGVAIGVTSRLAVIAFRLSKAILTGQILKKKGIASVFAGGGKLGGLKGFALRGGIAAAATIGTGIAVNNMMGGGETPQLDVPEAPATPAIGAFGGGFAGIKDLFTNATSGLSSKVSPFTAFFGSGGLASLMQGMNGVVSGPKGIDKVPAMLTDGEFVMSRGAVQKFGVNTLEAMNAAGGGTNQPKIIRGVPHAAGGGLIGGVDELRAKYDAKHGAGSYDKESARRKAQYASEDAAAEAKTNKKPVRTETALTRELKAQAGRGTKTTTINGLTIPIGINPSKFKGTGITNPSEITSAAKSSAKGIVGSINALTGVGSGRLTADQQRRIAEDAAQRNRIMQQGKQRRSADDAIRKEWNKAFSDPTNPLYQKAAFDETYNYEKFKKDYLAKQSNVSNLTEMKYTPYQSKFPGARDAAFEKAKGIGGFAGIKIGGFAGIKSSDYYRANTKSKEASLSKLSSKERLQRLSGEGSGKGRRFETESASGKAEFAGRGGMLGGIGRGLTRMFGSEKDKARVAAQDKASESRTKQAGAASIGRYYSSSDGKYYKDYAAAQKARQARLAKSSPNRKPITPTPKPAPKVVKAKPQVAGGGMGGGRGGGKPSVPKFPASSGGNKKNAKIYGIK
jgi:hypothetical protein